jgi:hypothetical protein
MRIAISNIKVKVRTAAGGIVEKQPFLNRKIFVSVSPAFHKHDSQGARDGGSGHKRQRIATFGLLLVGSEIL